MVDEGVARLEKSRLIFPELLGIKPKRSELDEVMADEESVNSEYGEDFDVRELMKAAKDPLTGSLRDLKIDDRDLPMANNYADWCYRVSGSKERPWSRQLWVMLKLFNELCPKCNRPDWYSDVLAIPKDMDGEELASRLTIMNNGICPTCHSRKSDMVRNGEMKIYDELVTVWGQRSGKSTTAVMGSSYQQHRFLKFPIFGSLIPTMSVSTPLTASFVSLNFGKAFAVLWQPLKTLISNTPWHTELFKLLDFYGNQYGEELYFRRKEFLQYNHKNLMLRPCSPSWDALRGDTRFVGIVDELGLFRLPDENEADDDGENEDQSKRANADEAHKSLDNSLLTVRNAAEYMLLEKGIDAVPTGILMGVSSPTSNRDKVMRLLAESKTDIGGSHMLGSQLPTWEVNPTIQRTSTAIVNAYAKNASKAERDFGANPTTTSSAYMSSSSVSPMFGKYKSTHVLEYVLGPNRDMWAVAKQIRPVDRPTIMVLDAGLVNNSFGITCFSLHGEHVRTETVCELVPRDGRRINFNQLYLHALRPIAWHNYSVLMAADQWQSLDTLSRFVADSKYKKSKSKRFSLARKHFDSVRGLVEDQTFLLPRPEMDIEPVLDNPDIVENYRSFFSRKPIAHLGFQLVTIRDLGPTSCPEKGIGLTDDIARSWFLGAYLMQDSKVRKLLVDAKKDMPKSKGAGGPIGIYKSRMTF